jgi:hypothetical protein
MNRIFQDVSNIHLLGRVNHKDIPERHSGNTLDKIIAHL